LIATPHRALSIELLYVRMSSISVHGPVQTGSPSMRIATTPDARLDLKLRPMKAYPVARLKVGIERPLKSALDLDTLLLKTLLDALDIIRGSALLKVLRPFFVFVLHLASITFIIRPYRYFFYYKNV
jgi:hypothetical protein